MQKRIDFDMHKPKEVAINSSGLCIDTYKGFATKSKKVGELVELLFVESSVFWVSEGEWSMHQLLMALLDKVGAANVYISSYAMGETPARILANLKSGGLIKHLICVLDSRVEVRTAGSLQLMKGICDQYALIATHAKVTLIETESHTISCIGSANYTENKRFEAGCITLNKEVFHLNKQWITDAIK